MLLQLACKAYATGCAKLTSLSIKLTSLCNFCDFWGLRRGEVYGFTNATRAAFQALQVFAQWITTGLWTQLEMEETFCPPLTCRENGSIAFLCLTTWKLGIWFSKSIVVCFIGNENIFWVIVFFCLGMNQRKS